MTRLFLELAGRLPMLSHCHQAHREDGSWLLLVTLLYAWPQGCLSVSRVQGLGLRVLVVGEHEGGRSRGPGTPGGSGGGEGRGCCAGGPPVPGRLGSWGLACGLWAAAGLLHCATTPLVRETTRASGGP